MNKKQRKRREKQARHEAHNAAKVLVHGKSDETKADNDKTHDADKNPNPREAHVNPSRWEKIIKWADHHSPITALILTVALVYVGTLQACIYRQQLDTARKDERPWLRIIPQMDIRGPQEGMAQLGTIKLVNSGKSPAKNVFVDVDVEKISPTANPSFDYSNPHVTAKTGMLYPNVETTPVDYIPVGTLRDPQTFYLVPISADEMKQFALGDMVLVIYVKASYTDFFRVQHWTHFCTWIANDTVSKEPRKYNVGACTTYNDTDDN